MFHDMFAGVADYSQKMKSRMDFYEKEWGMIQNHVKQYTKLTDKDCEAMRSGEMWLFPTEALEKGCVDEII
jgi:ATP-dependent protease ClpP protease subunit